MEKRILAAVFGILIAVLGWIWSAQYGKLTEIEKSLIELKLEVTKLQMSIIDENAVVKIVENELLKHGIK